MKTKVFSRRGRHRPPPLQDQGRLSPCPHERSFWRGQERQFFVSFLSFGSSAARIICRLTNPPFSLNPSNRLPPICPNRIPVAGDDGLEVESLRKASKAPTLQFPTLHPPKRCCGGLFARVIEGLSAICVRHNIVAQALLQFLTYARRQR